MLVFYILYSITIVSSYRYLPEKKIAASISQNNQEKLRKYTASIIDVPYQILIAYGNYFCSGILIRSKIAITAASCFLKDADEIVVVKIGASTINGPGQVIAVREIKKHEYFRHLSVLDNDIAMLLLYDDVIFGDNVKKGILVDPEVAIRPGSTINVYGWGGSNLVSKFMNKIIVSEMMVVDKYECEKYYGHILSPSNYCAKYRGDRRMSDNGGPATYGDLIVGILSFGASNQQEPFVAVVTNISYFHRWIQINSERFLKKYCQVKDYYIFNGRNDYGILS